MFGGGGSREPGLGALLLSASTPAPAPAPAPPPGAQYVAQQIPKVSRTDLCVPEAHARFLFKQLVAGVDFLHFNHVRVGVGGRVGGFVEGGEEARGAAA